MRKRNYHEHAPRKRKKLWQLGLTLGLFVLLVFLTRGIVSLSGKVKHANTLQADLTQQESVLQTKEADLQAEINQLQTQAGIENEIRKKFPVIKEGEEVIVIIEE